MKLELFFILLSLLNLAHAQISFEGHSLRSMTDFSVLEDYAYRTGLDLSLPQASKTIPDRPLSSRIDPNGKEYFFPFELDKSDVIKIGVATSAAVIFFANDKEISDFVKESHGAVSLDLAKFGASFGSTGGLAAIGTGMIVGIISENNEIKKVTFMAAKSILISSLATTALKVNVNRERPDGGNTDPYNFNNLDMGGHNQSFPSGHTTMAFALATVLAESGKSYNKYIPLLAYSAAAVTGWSRVHDSDHWASDVVMGGLIGHLVAKNVMNSSNNKKGFLLIPQLNQRDGFRLNLTYINKDPKVQCDYKKDFGFCLEKALNR